MRYKGPEQNEPHDTDISELISHDKHDTIPAPPPEGCENVHTRKTRTDIRRVKR